MKLADWLVVAAVIVPLSVGFFIWMSDTDHDVKVNSSGIERVEEVNDKQDAVISKLQEKTSSIDSRLSRIETQQKSNTKLLEKMDRRLEKVLEKRHGH